jgi:RimJ/RimL family protein N-acetyltransferase
VNELRGERVLLRPFRPDEHERAWAERERSTTTIGTPGPDARERFLKRLAVSGDWHDGRLDLAVEAAGELVGEVDARAPQNAMPPGVCEFGIELWEEWRGAGIGGEVVGLLTGWLHEQGYPRVQAGTNVTNGPMRRVLEKAGYEHEGTMRSFAPEGDARADYALYAHVG